MINNNTNTQLTDASLGGARPVAIVLADELVGQELNEIFGKIELASLMIAGRSVIEHVLSELQDLNFDQCIVLAGNNAASIQEMVGNDGRWGMTLTVMNYARSTEQILHEFKSLSEENGLLVVEASTIRGHCLKEFLTRANQSEYSLLEARDQVGRVGISLLKPTPASFVINPMPITIESLSVNSLDSAQDFHRANFDLVSGVFRGLEPGVVVNNQHGRRQHWSSHVSRGVSGDWPKVMIDRRCQVGRKAFLNAVILNPDVYVEGRASLDNTIVMPNSVISSAHKISNSIVNRGTVFQLN